MNQVQHTTINAEEVERFSKIAQEWWDENGKFRPLHKFNPVRLAYIKQKICQYFSRDVKALDALKGLRVLDIGCGGGLLCEPLARLGAKIVGADAAEKNIKVAMLHAKEEGLQIDYRATTAERLASEGEKFDIVLNMEVVEHVDNVPLFLQACAEMVKPGGLMFVATLNRSWKAFLLAIIGAEYILNWLPKGTHSYKKFLQPSELKALLQAQKMEVVDESGVQYNPLLDKWHLSSDMEVNYMLLLRRAK